MHYRWSKPASATSAFPSEPLLFLASIALQLSSLRSRSSKRVCCSVLESLSRLSNTPAACSRLPRKANPFFDRPSQRLALPHYKCSLFRRLWLEASRYSCIWRHFPRHANQISPLRRSCRVKPKPRTDLQMSACSGFNKLLKLMQWAEPVVTWKV